jgi:hypothetical protein
MSDYEAAKRDEMFTGYLDGYNDARIDFPERSDRSEAYKHGWLNGRDDRIGVRAKAAVTPSFATQFPGRRAAPVAIFVPVDFARIRARRVGGSVCLFGKTLQTAAPAIIVRKFDRSGRGIVPPRSGRGGVPGFNQSRFLGALVHAYQQFARPINVCLSQSPFVWVAARHEQQSTTEGFGNDGKVVGENRNV